MPRAADSKILIRAAFGALVVCACLVRAQPQTPNVSRRVPTATTDPEIILRQALKAVGGEAWAKVRIDQVFLGGVSIPGNPRGVCTNPEQPVP
jgi:hypothetical protein